MNAKRQALLGLFFVLVFGVLGWFTLFKSDLSLFSEKVTVSVKFQGAGGLRAGDPVLVAGLRWGEVESLDYDPQKPLKERVEVVLTLDQEVQLFGNHTIRIEEATVLGGKQLVIDPGEPSFGEVGLTGLLGSVSPNVMKALGDLVGENRESLRNILSGIEAVIGDVREGEGVISNLLYDQKLASDLNNAVAAVSESFQNIEALTKALRDGEGTIGQLLTKDEIYLQIKDIANGIDTFVTTAQTMADDIQAGKGTVGMLLYDEEVSADVKEAIDRLSTVARNLEEGKGTLGMLLNDPTIGENIKTITGNLAEGRGTLGRLLVEEEVYEDLATLLDNLADASAALRDGQGTISKLLYEDELYEELKKGIRVLTGSLEEAREAAPISTFLNTVFLGF
ncbi:MAG: MlaD family protein [Planctomycetota bacterium]|nr:MlaD family protein [Planctomycetota bacterium]